MEGFRKPDARSHDLASGRSWS